MKERIIGLSAYYREHTRKWLLHLAIFLAGFFMVSWSMLLVLPPLGYLVYRVVCIVAIAVGTVWVVKHRKELDGKKTSI